MKKTYLNLSFNNSEFHSIALKLRNLSNKIDALLSTGKFWEFTKSQQDRLLSKLRSLFEKLSGYNLKYAMKIAGAALCFTLISGSAKALPTFDNYNPNNPFPIDEILGHDFDSWNIIDGAFADVDGDGDKDAILLVQSYPGQPVYAAYFEYENDVFTENEAENPFSYSSGTETLYNIYAAGIDMADFDGDGDGDTFPELDAILTGPTGSIRHYRLNGGKFSWATSSWLNLNSGCSINICAEKAKFSDVDEDGDLDIVGLFCDGAVIRTLIQDSSTHNFTKRDNFPASNDIAPQYSEVFINMADMDGDGDDDLFVYNAGSTQTSQGLGDAGSNISYYENTPSSGPFSLVCSGIPLPLDYMSDEFFPILADLNGDGDIDVFTPGDGSSSTFENLGGNTVPISPFVALLAFAATGFGIFKRNRKKKTE